MHTFDFKNRTAVVTGGAQGFGLDVAKRFIESGAKVFIWDIDEKLLKSAVDEVKNPNLFYSVVDISNYKDVEKNVAEITSKSNIDILINNAGITGPTGPLWEYDVDMWNKIVQINLMGTFNCCRAIVPNMIKNKELSNKDLYSIDKESAYYYSGGWHIKGVYSLLLGFIFSASTIWNTNLMFLQSYAWIIGAFVAWITYYLLAKK